MAIIAPFVLKLCDLADFSLSGISVLIALISMCFHSKVLGSYCKFSQQFCKTANPFGYILFNKRFGMQFDL